MNLNGSAGLPNFPYKLYGHQAPVDFEFSSFSIIFPVPGFLIKPINGQKGCEVGYVTHTNPRGKIPTWLTNKVTSYVAPRMLRKLHKACIQYPQWKAQHRPNFKYWLNPEQLTSPKINMPDCTPPKHDDFESSSPDSCLEEDLNSLKIDSDNESLEDP